MLAWLNGWLKQLILIVLIAGFIELLLPTQSMQRYVRTVIGLFLLMVMLSPLFQLFQRGWTPEQVMAQAEAELSKDQGVSGHYQTLSEILQQASKLQLNNRDDAKQMLEAGLASAIKNGIEQQLSEQVQQIQVKTVIDDKGNPSIDAVDVVLAENKNKPPEAGSASSGSGDGETLVQPVKPVKPVIVDIKPLSSQEAVPAVAGAAEGKDGSQRRDAVRQYISREWQAKPEHISVSIQ